MSWNINYNVLLTFGGVFIFYGFYENIDDFINFHSRTYHEKVAMRLFLMLIGILLIIAIDNDGDCSP